jgi:hypothetical protein
MVHFLEEEHPLSTIAKAIQSHFTFTSFILVIWSIGAKNSQQKPYTIMLRLCMLRIANYSKMLKETSPIQNSSGQ